MSCPDEDFSKFAIKAVAVSAIMVAFMMLGIWKFVELLKGWLE